MIFLMENNLNKINDVKVGHSHECFKFISISSHFKMFSKREDHNLLIKKSLTDNLEQFTAPYTKTS